MGGHLPVLYIIKQEVHPPFYDPWKREFQKSLPEIAAAAREALGRRQSAPEGIQDYSLKVELGEGPARKDIVNFAEKTESI